MFASFILTGMFVKTVLTVGFAQTVEKISAFNMGTAEQLVTSDKYLRNSLARATLNTFFLVVAWTLIGMNNITLFLVDVFNKRWVDYKGMSHLQNEITNTFASCNRHVPTQKSTN